MKRELKWVPLACIFLWLAMGVGCVETFHTGSPLPKLTWHGSEMVVQDSSQDSAGRKVFEFKNSKENPELICKCMPLSSEWHAYRAWQDIPGNRSALPGSVFSSGWYSMVGGNALIQCSSLGAGLLSQENWAESFRWSGLPVQREPEFSQYFLQQNRIEFTGYALPSNFLGLSWEPPLYGMRYVYLQDTIEAFLAGPQDSLFFQTHRTILGIRKEGDFFENEGIQSLFTPNGLKRWWRWGPHGWVGLEGCSQTPKCSLWVEKQYEVLKIFERDGFFSLKNATGN